MIYNLFLYNIFSQEFDEQDPMTTTKDIILHGLHHWSQHQAEASFSIVHDKERGRCVVSRRVFKKGTFVLEYEGDFITKQVKEERDKVYEELNSGSYVVDVTWKNQQRYIDATKENSTVGRLVNHSRGPNLKPFRLIQVSVGEPPRMGFFACEEIDKGDEVFWDYGLADGETPWATFRRVKKAR